MNSDIRISTVIRSHRKIKKLRKRLGAEGVLALIFLWAGTAESKPDGTLENWDEEDIALEAQWPGNPSELVETLLDLGLLESCPDGYKVHDWAENQPWAANASERSEKARKSQLFRWAKKGFQGEKLDHFREWFEDVYNFSSEHNTKRILELYETYTGRNTPTPSLPLPSSPKDIHSSADESAERSPACPHLEIIDKYHEMLPELSRVKKNLWKGTQREKNLRARWSEDKERQSLEWWEDFFVLVSGSDFLMGRVKEWKADLGWLVKKENLVKTLEGKYQARNGSPGGTMVPPESKRQTCEYNQGAGCANISRKGEDFCAKCDSYRSSLK